MAAGRRVKEEGAQNDLLERIAKDGNFSAVHATLDQLLDPAVSEQGGGYSTAASSCLCCHVSS